MKKQKIIISTFAIIFVMLLLASPALACKTRPSTTKIPFTHTIYYIAAVPGETTTNGNMQYIMGGTSKAISLDGTLVSDGENIFKVINTVTGKGFSLGKFVDTYTNSIIGTGVMKGVSYSRITATDGSIGTCSIIAYGSTDEYSNIKEVSEASWHPTSTPFPTVVLTVTGYYIVQS